MVLWAVLFLSASAAILAAVFQVNKHRGWASSLIAASAVSIITLVLANMVSRSQGGGNVGRQNQDGLEIELLILGLTVLSFFAAMAGALLDTMGAKFLLDRSADP